MRWTGVQKARYCLKSAKAAVGVALATAGPLGHGVRNEQPLQDLRSLTLATLTDSTSSSPIAENTLAVQGRREIQGLQGLQGHQGLQRHQGRAQKTVIQSPSSLLSLQSLHIRLSRLPCEASLLASASAKAALPEGMLR